MPWSSWFIIIILLLLCLFLWVRKVWHIMHDRMRTVDLAAEQLRIFRAMENDLKNEDVLKRSEDLYSQAVRLYQIALENPFNWLPATLMGFRPITKGNATQSKEK